MMIRRALLNIAACSAIGADISSLAIAVFFSFLKFPEKRVGLVNQEE
jgi:hypothetical protein